VPDEKWGEKVTAVVVRKAGITETDLDDDKLKAFCRGKIAGYKLPKEVLFINEEEMPRTPTGKILHRKLRERFGE
jgi:acyl-CoA synthetase (AMP-forming)/AMP-acid ligase II